MSAPDKSARLFKTIPLGGGRHQIHRLALAPLTRLRAGEGTNVPSPLAIEYYAQRAAAGTLEITEATFIAREAGGYPRAPGLYTEEHIAAWKQVTDAVHTKGGLIYAQLWALGRAHNDPPLHGHMDDVPTIGPSAVGVTGRGYPPKEMTLEDIKRFIGHYKQAAINADKAGFDGVEVHLANGYLPDQFLQSNSNKRTDDYGGSLPKRARFGLEVVAAAVEAIGAERVGLRISPWGTFQDMGEANPFETFGYLLTELTKAHPKLSYVHAVEPREWFGKDEVGKGYTFDIGHLAEGVKPSNDPFRAILRGIDPATLKDDESNIFPDPTAEHPTVFVSAGGFDPESALKHSERTGDVVAFGRHFISTPDLPSRIQKGLPLADYDRNTFYTNGAEGYIDYPAFEVKVQA